MTSHGRSRTSAASRCNRSDDDSSIACTSSSRSTVGSSSRTRQQLGDDLLEPCLAELLLDLLDLSRGHHVDVHRDAEERQERHQAGRLGGHAVRHAGGDVLGLQVGRDAEDVAQQAAEREVRRRRLVLLARSRHDRDVVDPGQRLRDQAGLADARPRRRCRGRDRDRRGRRPGPGRGQPSRRSVRPAAARRGPRAGRRPPPRSPRRARASTSPSP